MFSGSFGGLPRDANGRIFLDFDPDCFEVLFNHLRLLQLTGLPSANSGALAAPRFFLAIFSKFFDKILRLQSCTKDWIV